MKAVITGGPPDKSFFVSIGYLTPHTTYISFTFCHLFLYFLFWDNLRTTSLYGYNRIGIHLTLLLLAELQISTKANRSA